jgi:diguanylate cyclase
VSLSIDDFGTGYSSLVHLKQLPVHELKIARAFVAGMAERDEDEAIVRSTVALGHNLGLRVVAEGVEDRRAWDRLGALGCDVAQGFFLARPMPAAEVASWLRGAGSGAAAERLLEA